MEFICPLCASSLEYEFKNNSYEFSCSSCGFTKISPLGFTLEEGYQWINKSFNQNQKENSANSTHFPTKRKKKAIYVNDVEILEQDELIAENDRKLKERISKQEVPEILQNILTQEEHYSVYFDKFKKRLPKSGKNISEIIKEQNLIQVLKEKNIVKLYKFQEDSYKAIINGDNVIISAPTGLGKTEAFLLPILHVICQLKESDKRNESTSALLVYPTKALAADQLVKLTEYANCVGLTVAKYDGDTNKAERQKIYQEPPDILITNPDMIHYHLMGNITFQALITKVKFLVLDEIHLSIGTFGTNISWIIRRLKRFSPFIQLIGASATISNAQNFAEQLFDDTVNLITVGTARKSDLYLSILYPRERSNLSTMAYVAQEFAKNNYKSLVFGNGHKSAEVLNLILKDRGFKSDIHRAGLDYIHRKKVETNFKNNNLDLLVSTPTLELGIDIGDLDVVISSLTGINSFIQRIGRAGRSGQDSYSVLVLRGDDPISAFYARNPNEYLTDIEPAYVEVNNELIARYQILAMLLDKPMERIEEAKYLKFIEPLKKENRVISLKGKLLLKDPNWARSQLKNYSIRGIGNSVKIFNHEKQIGERSLPLALSELHPGAIYLHGGNSYQVTDYDNMTFTSKVSRISTRSEKTQALRSIWPEINDIEFETNVKGLSVAYTNLSLTETVTGYVKSNIFTNKVIGQFTLDNPISYKFKTKGFLLSLPKPVNFIENYDKKSREEVLGGTYHAIEHTIIEGGNSITGGGSTQIGGISMGSSGTIFVYDGTEGGSGLSKLLFNQLDRAIDRTLKILEDCPCKRVDGCPRCTYSYQCGNNNRPLNRIGAIETLKLFGEYSTDLRLDFNGLETFVINPD